jgi:hypothetical protein
VTADVGNVAAGVPPAEREFIKANPVDVEDWGTLTVTFTARRYLQYGEGRSKDGMAIRLSRGGMDARLSTGDPRFHGMRQHGPPAFGRSRPRLRYNGGAIRRILVSRGRQADQAPTLIGFAEFTLK